MSKERIVNKLLGKKTQTEKGISLEPMPIRKAREVLSGVQSIKKFLPKLQAVIEAAKEEVDAYPDLDTDAQDAVLDLSAFIEKELEPVVDKFAEQTEDAIDTVEAAVRARLKRKTEPWAI